MYFKKFVGISMVAVLTLGG
ncbi:Protein of unknown function [Bacillus cytotoxicus]|uniref:Uncharacterized protein n=1 Tax=Bacillus cytotoxicus TaxID=580165 RepID=A0AAX2CDF8_9BACI|nr:Protein of unknown function [Bacillus cytotoxicus]SCN32188.1 Protein of unknown function [Bacillus cytotoxicus]